MLPYPKLYNENFKSWFEDSKGVDANNEIQVYYHKSNSPDEFTVFKNESIQKNEYNHDCHGFYFVADYHKHCVEYMGRGKEYFVLLKMKNPFYIYDNGMGLVEDSDGKKHDLLNINNCFCWQLEVRGFDSIIIICPKYYNQYIVFHPNQIKSVYNNGDYSKSDDDINK